MLVVVLQTEIGAAVTVPTEPPFHTSKVPDLEGVGAMRMGTGKDIAHLLAVVPPEKTPRSGG